MGSKAPQSAPPGPKPSPQPHPPSKKAGLMLLPAKPGTCPECATEHEPHLPHNHDSLYYQYHFYFQHERWPTWHDAMAHCDPQMKSFWIEALAKRGVIIQPTEDHTHETIHAG